MKKHHIELETCEGNKGKKYSNFSEETYLKYWPKRESRSGKPPVLEVIREDGHAVMSVERVKR